MNTSNKIAYSSFERELLDLDNKYFGEGFNPDFVNYFNVHRPKALVKDLQQRVQTFDPSYLPAIIQQGLDDTVVNSSVSDLLGTGHVIAFIETAKHGEVVVRANASLPYPETYMELEFDFLKIYNDLGIPVNDLIHADSSRKVFPFDYQIMKKLPGNNLGSQWEGTQSDYEKICFQQGQYIARMSQYKGRGWGRIGKDENGLYGVYGTHNDFLTAFLEHDLEVIKLFELINADEFSQLMEFFKSDNVKSLFADSIASLIHNDPSDLNMCYEGSKFLCFFDWENAAMFDPINELGTAPTWKSAFPKRGAMIKGYVAELGYKPDNLNEKMNVFFLRKMIDKVAFALKGERLSRRHIDFLIEGFANNGIILSDNTLNRLNNLEI